jgi:hypothetical protein
MFATFITIMFVTFMLLCYMVIVWNLSQVKNKRSLEREHIYNEAVKRKGGN